MSKISEYKAIYFNPDDTDFEKMNEVHMNNIKRITRNIDNKCLSEMLFNRDEKLLEIINIQQDRIDKAIEYIKEQGHYCIIEDEGNCLCDLQSTQCDYLLDILGGEDNESN